MNVRWTAALIAFLVALATACVNRPGRTEGANQQPQSAVTSQSTGLEAIVDPLVAAEALSRGVPGLAVVIVADGEVLVQRGYGIADVASGRAVTGADALQHCLRHEAVHGCRRADARRGGADPTRRAGERVRPTAVRLSGTSPFASCSPTRPVSPATCAETTTTIPTLPNTGGGSTDPSRARHPASDSSTATRASRCWGGW